MLEIGFINPSSDYLFDPFKGDPHTHFQILTVLEDRLNGKVKPSLIDLRGVDRNFALSHIPEQDVYLHSVYTLDYEEQEGLKKFRLLLRETSAIGVVSLESQRLHLFIFSRSDSETGYV